MPTPRLEVSSAPHQRLSPENTFGGYLTSYPPEDCPVGAKRCASIKENPLNTIGFSARQGEGLARRQRLYT